MGTPAHYYYKATFHELVVNLTVTVISNKLIDSNRRHHSPDTFEANIAMLHVYMTLNQHNIT